MIGNKVQNKIMKRIKHGKYFAVILYCAPDKRHQEQMSFSLSYVLDGTLPGLSIRVYKQSIKLIHVESSAGENLFSVSKQEIKSLRLNINNIRGYDNVSEAMTMVLT